MSPEVPCFSSVAGGARPVCDHRRRMTSDSAHQPTPVILQPHGNNMIAIADSRLTSGCGTLLPPHCRRCRETNFSDGSGSALMKVGRHQHAAVLPEGLSNTNRARIELSRLMVANRAMNADQSPSCQCTDGHACVPPSTSAEAGTPPPWLLWWLVLCDSTLGVPFG